MSFERHWIGSYSWRCGEPGTHFGNYPPNFTLRWFNNSLDGSRKVRGFCIQIGRRIGGDLKIWELSFSKLYPPRKPSP